ncbi:MarR family winged helix-turn-helix transcriptional regulator [Cohnella cholangitidis]|uniref:MarR family transcriptional regulator n=1 Tax=Cohnella cholangitidis TaxID=2598458 RepID=A0A7G5BSK7_9BACL|nr:MarR family transcriptional regulator [Cohnella cholangitidis]QMV39941.1 MarR family transcriptional regulator [Cohnella cholangitidis]
MNIENIAELRSDIHKFIRLFGLLEQNVTPCGYPLSVSKVHALQELENASLSITELSRKLHLERSSVSRLVDALVKENLICREVNESNRKETILTLSDKGLRSVSQIRSQSIKFYQDVLAPLSYDDRVQIYEAFKKFNGALHQYRGKGLKHEPF